jgi:hypothetical protein
MIGIHAERLRRLRRRLRAVATRVLDALRQRCPTLVESVGKDVVAVRLG